MYRRISLICPPMLSLLMAMSVALPGCESGGEMTVLAIEPKMGHVQGDQAVRILGRNFRQDISYRVYFGSREAGSVTILNSETILATTPTNVDKGSVDITIRADDGSAFRIREGFRFQEVSQGLGADQLGKTEDVSPEQKGNLVH